MSTRVRGLALGVIAVSLAACGSSGGHRAEAAPPALGAVPIVTEPGQVSLPTDAYLVTPAQITDIIRAQDLVTAQCMAEYGLTGRPTVLFGLDEVVSDRATRSLVYGYFDLANAGAKGYATEGIQQLPSGGDAAGGGSDQDQIALSGADPRTGQAVTALAGKPLPAGGCQQKGRDALGGSTPAPSVGDLPDGGPKVPVTDPRLVEAFATWSACMKEKGFDYKEPVNAIGDQAWRRSGGAGPSQQEIATATADVACKVANNTVGVAVAVQTAYANQYIESHTAKLTAYRQRIDDMLRKAAELAAATPAKS
ncbi:hypothetical protein [Kitasatospora sp. CB01950]|uniref:hypothetical protein n=1 Tax=Kitasatospora sp. CB01950 TaxID=1703930 RepID=UPI0011611398|nr:hypothetical protein [Kitasatospora sp. CB01950]